MNPNIGWLFQKEYFQNLLRDRATVEENRNQHTVTELDWSFVTQGNNETQRKRNAALLKQKNDRITRLAFRTADTQCLNVANTYAGQAISHFDLTTTYPGLVLGTGMTHEAHIEGEFKLGFHFDHTTGLPILPGSSIKGVLRSVFPSTLRSHQDKPKEGAKERISFLNEWVNIHPSLAAFRGLDANGWEALEMDIFEGLRKEAEGKKGYSIRVPNAYRDTWHDAYILKAANEGNRFLDSDYITPHLNRENPALSPFTNPVPLQFLKILPKVTFRFQFRLHDTEVQGKKITAADKLSLFQAILLSQGVGAKTNVGYGQFEQEVPPETIFVFKTPRKEEEKEDEEKKQTPPPKPEELSIYDGKISEGETIMVRILDPQRRQVEILLPAGKMTVEMGRLNNWPAPGVLVNATISQVNKKKGIIQMLTYKGPI